MTRKNKSSKAPVTWYAGRFPCIPVSGTTAARHLFLWGTLTQEVASKILPADTPDAALLDLYREATTQKTPPNIVHFIDEAMAPLGSALSGVKIKAGTRAAFISLVSETLNRVFMEEIKSVALPASYLSAGVSPAEVAGFFSASAALYRAKPWELFTCSGFLFRLEAPSLGLSNSLMHLEAFVSSRGAPLLVVKLDLDEDSDAELTFLGREEAGEELLAELDAQRWELASPEEVPQLSYFRDGRLAQPSLEAVRAMRCALEAIEHFIGAHRHLSLLPEATPVTEAVRLSWLPEAEVQITGPHPDFDFTPYEPSEHEFDDFDEDDETLSAREDDDFA